LQTIRIGAKKGSNSRILPLSPKAINMISNLPMRKGRIFAKADSMRTTLFLQRRISKRLPLLSLTKYVSKLSDIGKALSNNIKTKDPWHVKLILGHKSITSTETYIHIEKMLDQAQGNDQFTVKVADYSRMLSS